MRHPILGLLTILSSIALVIASAAITANAATPQLIAYGSGSPDDLAVSNTSDIYFGDFANSAINVIRHGGSKPSTLVAGLREPEGIVVTLDGALVVAEQGTNRLLEINAVTGSRRTLRQLENGTSREGVDGLGLDYATGDILVPDSPSGRLLRMSRDGKTITTIASGFVRPTGAAVEPVGGSYVKNANIIVADEFGNALYRVRPNGTRTRIARIYQPDDVIVSRSGIIYANSLSGRIYSLNPRTGALSVLASGMKLPHGIGLAPDGSLIVAEAGRNRILRVAAGAK